MSDPQPALAAPPVVAPVDKNAVISDLLAKATEASQSENDSSLSSEPPVVAQELKAAVVAPSEEAMADADERWQRQWFANIQAQFASMTQRAESAEAQLHAVQQIAARWERFAQELDVKGTFAGSAVADFVKDVRAAIEQKH